MKRKITASSFDLVIKELNRMSERQTPNDQQTLKEIAKLLSIKHVHKSNRVINKNLDYEVFKSRM